MIRSVRLENFKSFRDATLELEPFTLIVGANASGKSNLRDAFRFLHGVGMGWPLADIAGGHTEGGSLVWQGIRGGPKAVACPDGPGLVLAAEVQDRTFEIWVDHDGRSLVLTHEWLDDGTGRRVYWTSGISQPEPHLVSAHIAHATDKPVVTQFLRTAALLGQVMDSNAGWHVHADIVPVRRCLWQMRFFDLDPKALRQPSYPGQRLGDLGENLSSALYALCTDEDTKQSLLEWLRELTPMDAVGLDFPADPSGRVILQLVERDGTKTLADSASDGTLRFLGYLAAVLGAEAGSCLFFEEIENGLHPTRLRLLLDLFRRGTRGGEVQIIATTHSSALLGLLDDELLGNVRLTYRPEGRSDTVIFKLLDLPDARRVLAEHSGCDLHRTGWLEEAAQFAIEREVTV